MPDPASTFQPEDVFGPSEVVDHAAFAWRASDWRGRPWEEAVLIETHVGTFAAAGTYRAMIDKLDHLVATGITALELMPLADFAGRRGWGYDGVLWYAPDSAYGRPEDLKTLIDEAHLRGLMVFLDVVYNHFGPGGKLPRPLRAGLLHRRAHALGAARSITACRRCARLRSRTRCPGSPTTASTACGWTPPTTSWRSPASSRCCKISASRRANSPRRRGGTSISCWRTATIARACSMLRRIRRAANIAGSGMTTTITLWHVMLTGELAGYYADYQTPRMDLARALASGFVYQGEVSEFWGKKPRGEPSGGLPPATFVNFLQNHDQIGNRPLGDRLEGLASPTQIEAALAVTLLAPMIPMLFMGEEWGSTAPFPFFCDFQGGLADAVREGRRQEYAWAYEKYGDEVPDPLDPATLQSAVLDWTGRTPEQDTRARSGARPASRFRRKEIAPRLKGATFGDARGGRQRFADRALAHGRRNEAATGCQSVGPGDHAFQRQRGHADLGRRGRRPASALVGGLASRRLACLPPSLSRPIGFSSPRISASTSAAAVVPYLKALGITHLYTSPVMKARKGSTHGYDTVDHGQFNPELGGEAGFARLSEALIEHDLGLIIDFVPQPCWRALCR